MLVLTRNNTESVDQTQALEKQARRKSVRRGATVLEYLMMISLILVVCLVAIGFLGTSNSANMSSSSTSISKSLKKGS